MNKLVSIGCVFLKKITTKNKDYSKKKEDYLKEASWLCFIPQLCYILSNLVIEGSESICASIKNVEINLK